MKIALWLGAVALVAAAALGIALAVGHDSGTSGSSTVTAVSIPVVAAPTGKGIHKIQHVVIIMQENRSFDSYFGTYPGADGIPMRNGVPTVCVPDPFTHVCVRPFHTSASLNLGGPHDHIDAVRDIDHGKMDGFIKQAHYGSKLVCATHFDAPGCSYSKNSPDSV